MEISDPYIPPIAQGDHFEGAQERFSVDQIFPKPKPTRAVASTDSDVGLIIYNVRSSRYKLTIIFNGVYIHVSLYVYRITRTIK